MVVMWFSAGLLIIVAQIISCLGDGRTPIFFGEMFEDVSEADPETITQQEAFQAAIDIINAEPQELYSYIPLHEESFDHRTGPFKATLVACSFLEQQALVIFGPQAPDDIFAVQSICDYKDVAHVVTRWVPNPEEHRSIINFYPHSEELLDGYFTILKAFGWKSFTLFYENNDSLLRMGNLINLAKSDGFVVVVMQLTNVGDEEEGIYRRTLKQAVQSGQRNFVIDCSIDILQEVLTQAQQVGMMAGEFKYFITNLDLQTIDLEPFRYSDVNITGIRIFDPKSEYAQVLTVHLKNKHPDFDIYKLRTETALVIDAVTILTRIISSKIPVSEMELRNISCKSHESAKYGNTIVNHVKTSINKELTGLVEFDRNGFRSNFNLDVIEIRETEIAKIGNWNSTNGLVIAQSELMEDGNFSDSLRNRSFRVISCLTAPFCMLKETSQRLYGNDRFEGFAVDLIHELAQMEGFNYTFFVRDDTSNGEKLDNGEWNGMIGDIIQNKYDLAIADLTVTSEREEAVDFTSPFMNLGISILAKKPGNAPPSFFSFADPFALDTWIMISIAYAVVACSFFILGRLSKDEWDNPYPCIEEPEFLINQYTLSNSFWYAAGGLLQQGSEIAAIGLSTRMLSGMWWLFILVMVSSYTANLAAFLATENPQNLFTDVKTLVENKDKNEIRMGAKKGGATQGFFKGKDNPIYKVISQHMETHPEDMPKDNKYGVEYAEKYTYAFFMESTSIEYETQRHCDLKQYGSLLDDKGYGIAMRKNSTYRTKLSTAILKLQASGEIDKIKRRWWEEKRGGGQCLADDADEATPPLSVKNVEGVVYITIGGTIAAVFVVIAEFLVKVLKISKKTKVPFKEILRLEMKYYFDFNSNAKPPIKSTSKSRSKSTELSNSGNGEMLSVHNYGFIPTITRQEFSD